MSSAFTRRSPRAGVSCPSPAHGTPASSNAERLTEPLTGQRQCWLGLIGRHLHKSMSSLIRLKAKDLAIALSFHPQKGFSRGFPEGFSRGFPRAFPRGCSLTEPGRSWEAPLQPSKLQLERASSSYSIPSSTTT